MTAQIQTDAALQQASDYRDGYSPPPWEDDEDGCCDLENEEPCCEYCGKPFEDFSDLGCERCDRRHPDYGVIP